MNIEIVGIGGDPEHSRAVGSFASSDIESFSDADFEELKNHGAVGSICARFFNKHGEPCNVSMDRRVISLETTMLKNIPLVIAAAGGKHKTDAIIGAAKGKLFNVLITDEYTAYELLERLRNIK